MKFKLHAVKRNGWIVKIATLMISLILRIAATGAPNASLSDCHRPFPDFELFVPVGLEVSDSKRRNSEVLHFFLRSYFLFWPLDKIQTRVHFLFDEEVANSTAYNDTVQAMATMLITASKHLTLATPLRMDLFAFDVTQPSIYYNNNGYERMQWLNFWADNFTKSEFVAFADTDTLFISYIDREDLFEFGKPVVNGRIGIEGRKPWRNVPRSTYSITGLEEPLRCMAYFPVIIKTAHLREIRAHITAHMKKQHFDEAFRDFPNYGFYSQYNVMCTILFWNYRDEYRFYAHDLSPYWNGAVNPRPNYGQWSDKSIFDAYSFELKPRIAIHARWYSLDGAHNLVHKSQINHDELKRILRRGICDAPPFPSPSSQTFAFCQGFAPRTDELYTSEEHLRGNGTLTDIDYNAELHQFEFEDWNLIYPKRDLMMEHKKRFERIRNCTQQWLLIDSAFRERE